MAVINLTQKQKNAKEKKISEYELFSNISMIAGMLGGKR